MHTDFKGVGLKHKEFCKGKKKPKITPHHHNTLYYLFISMELFILSNVKKKEETNNGEKYYMFLTDCGNSKDFFVLDRTFHPR